MCGLLFGKTERFAGIGFTLRQLWQEDRAPHSKGHLETFCWAAGGFMVQAVVLN